MTMNTLIIFRFRVRVIFRATDDWCTIIVVLLKVNKAKTSFHYWMCLPSRACKNCLYGFPWLSPFSLTFPWPLCNSLTFPGFPGEWSPCGGRNGRGVGKTGVVGQEIRCRRQTTTQHCEWNGRAGQLQSDELYPCGRVILRTCEINLGGHGLAYSVQKMLACGQLARCLFPKNLTTDLGHSVQQPGERLANYVQGDWH